MTRPFSRSGPANNALQRKCGRRLQRAGEITLAAFR
jgi:hypothetical protein